MILKHAQSGAKIRKDTHSLFSFFVFLLSFCHCYFVVVVLTSLFERLISSPIFCTTFLIATGRRTLGRTWLTWPLPLAEASRA